MRQERESLLCVCAYARFGNIRQMFCTDRELIRHLYNELLEDGKAHSAREIYDYILEQTDGRGVGGSLLTGEAIYDAIGEISGAAGADAMI